MKRRKRKQNRVKLGSILKGAAFFVAFVTLSSYAVEADMDCDVSRKPYKIDGQVDAVKGTDNYIITIDGNIWVWESDDLKPNQYVTLEMDPNGTMRYDDDVIMSVKVQEED